MKCFPIILRKIPKKYSIAGYDGYRITIWYEQSGGVT